MFTLAVEEEFLVNELTAVVRVKPEDREGKFPAYVLQGFQDPTAGFAAQGGDLGPPRGNIGKREAVDHVGGRNATVLGH